jgi:outer membrane protein assembly factor BamB
MGKLTLVVAAGLLAGTMQLAASENGAAQDFPCWRGADGSGAANSGLTLIEDISKAKLVWKSEWIPGVYGALIQSGNSGVIVADGKVFLTYQEPNDDACDEAFVAKMLEVKTWAGGRGGYGSDPAYLKAVADPKLREAYARKKFAIAANDVIHCFDAETGKTLWTNDFSAGNTANCPTPAFADGYVFWANGYGKGGICLKLGDEALFFGHCRSG